MKKLGLIFLLVSQVSVAADTHYIPLKKCIMTYPIELFVAAKIDENIYALAQAATPVTNKVGFIQMSYQPNQGERLNIRAKYLGMKKMMGGDGFEHMTDMWLECKPGEK